MKKIQKKKQDFTPQTTNKHSGGGRCKAKHVESSHVTVTTTRMTPEQERQFSNALDLFLAEMVRQIREGKGT